YPLSLFYPFGSAAGDNQLSAVDDGSTSKIPISVPFPFFGSLYNSTYVNNNGDITFETPLTQYTSEPFPINGTHRIIAPFWTDIDTTEGGSLWYRTTNDVTTLQRGASTVHSLFPDITQFTPTWMMVVTWDDVAAYSCSTTCNQRNTFQLILITNGIHSFAVFNYNKIIWTKSTQVGFNAGDGEHYFSVPGSMTDAVLNLTQMSNIGVPGQFVFRVDEAKISNADTVDECASSPCRHGNCSNEYLYYECICDPGYSGVNCENEIDECQSSPCLHGNCSDGFNHYTCHCQAGYSGNNCETEIDECASSPCVYGTCTDFVSGYACNCMTGYMGMYCETDINECQSSPCIHGNCSDHVNRYTCQCYPGYAGTNCQINIDDCVDSPCFHGNCTDQVNGYICECEARYSGVVCETEIDRCTSSPCVHGSCIDKIDDYFCVCDTGYHGRKCSVFEFSYLTPLWVGLLVLLFTIIPLILWKKSKSQESERRTALGIIHFDDVTLGASKKSYRNQEPVVSNFLTIRGFISLIWHKDKSSWNLCGGP
ncbi:sushi, nidogen and EGF-like domain-containing protein 1, partial [Ostrea edulis]|uniref:sushi, nidogen and EGF-like domain-containing protein 1 n=1 Tax=Ostrea edulis TaxID=37623 RepID=UPI0024AEE716